MQHNKKRVLYIITGLVLLVVAIGLSYAYFIADLRGNETASTISGTAGYLELTYTDGQDIINATDILPGWSASKAFTVENTGEVNAYYVLKIVNITNNFSVPGSISFEINSTDGGANIEKKVLPTSTKNITLSIKIAPGVTHHYTVTTYYNNLDIDQSADLGKTFNYSITIASALEPMPDGWLTPPDGSLLAAIKANQSTPNKDNDPGMTNPGQEITAQSGVYMSEGLREAEDDYGISYYFRGAVENNYIVFAKMCWRIVRVDGAGNIKIVLFNFNNNKTNVINPCTVTGNNLGYAKNTNNSQLNSPFNSLNVNTNSSIGLMYGTPGTTKTGNMRDIDAYDTEHFNNTENKSTILEALETWYTNNFSASDEAKLADVIWCNDKSLSDPSFVPGGSSGYNHLGYNNNTTAYGAIERLVNTTSWQATTDKGPSFKCPDASGSDIDLSRFTIGTSLTGNKKLQYPIGLLTADEVAFAGAAYGTASLNTKYYLYPNASSLSWWTLSPGNFASGNARNIIVGNNGNLNIQHVNVSYALRPVVALKSDTTVTKSSAATGGEFGSATNPFVVD